MRNLLDRKCEPCEGDVKPLTKNQYSKYLNTISGWNVEKDIMLLKNFKLNDFKNAISFVNKIGQLAESEGHHPNMYIHGWNKVRITLSTHAINGLSINDFILASKIDLLEKQSQT